jgi:hypothetical protein
VVSNNCIVRTAYEANFLRLLDKITNGSKFEINATGTALNFKPGVLIGGSFEHECNNERGISYYLEPLLVLAPFAKRPMTIKLKGVTANSVRLHGIPLYFIFFVCSASDDDFDFSLGGFNEDFLSHCF